MLEENKEFNFMDSWYASRGREPNFVFWESDNTRRVPNNAPQLCADAPDLHQKGAKDDKHKMDFTILPVGLLHKLVLVGWALGLRALAGMALLPLKQFGYVGLVALMGAEKYTPNGWRSVPNGVHRYKAAVFRHYLKILRGEWLDKESGLPHFAHIACNALFCMYLYDQNADDFTTSQEDRDLIAYIDAALEDDPDAVGFHPSGK